MTYQRIETNVFCNINTVIIEINRLNENNKIHNVDAKPGIIRFVITACEYDEFIKSLIRDHKFEFDPSQIIYYDRVSDEAYFFVLH